MNVACAVQKQCVAWKTVASCPADFLIVFFKRFWHIVVDYVSYVRLVNSHSECDGCYHYAHFILDEFILMVSAYFVRKPSVVVQY